MASVILDADYNADKPGSLEFHHSLLSAFSLIVIFGVAVDAVRKLAKGKSWATFFLARLGVAGTVFQVIHLASFCLGAFPIRISARIMWFMAPLGTAANLCLNIWRIRIFKYVVAQWMTDLLKAKYLVPVVLTTAYLLCWPIYVWIFNQDLMLRNAVISDWCTKGFIIWISLFAFGDSISAMVSLWKVQEVVVNGRSDLKRIIIVLLVAMVLLDLYSVGETIAVGTRAQFPFKRRDIAPLFSLSIIHISISYFYMIAIARFVMNKEKKDKKKEKAQRANSVRDALKDLRGSNASDARDSTAGKNSSRMDNQATTPRMSTDVMEVAMTSDDGRSGSVMDSLPSPTAGAGSITELIPTTVTAQNA